MCVQSTAEENKASAENLKAMNAHAQAPFAASAAALQNPDSYPARTTVNSGLKRPRQDDAIPTEIIEVDSESETEIEPVMRAMAAMQHVAPAVTVIKAEAVGLMAAADRPAALSMVGRNAVCIIFTSPKLLCDDEGGGGGTSPRGGGH